MKSSHVIGVMTICVWGLPGCLAPPKPIFDEAAAPVVWPKAPDQPRIRYIGQLTGEASLHAKRPTMEVLGEIFTGPRPMAAFSTPTAVAVAGQRIFVADGQNQSVYLLDLESRQFKTLRNMGGKALQWPADVIVAGDELIVADSKLPGVFVFDLDGNYRRSIESTTLRRPCALAWDQDSGSLYVLDSAEHRCEIFDIEGKLVSQQGQRGNAPGELNFPSGIVFASQRGVLIADAMNFRVQSFDREGRFISALGKKGDAAGDFALPRDVAVDSEGHVYVLDNQFENVQIFDAAGQLLMAWGQEGRGPGEFYLPSGITIDSVDRIWIADTYNRRVQVFQYLREPTQ